MKKFISLLAVAMMTFTCFAAKPKADKNAVAVNLVSGDNGKGYYVFIYFVSSDDEDVKKLSDELLQMDEKKPHTVTVRRFVFEEEPKGKVLKQMLEALASDPNVSADTLKKNIKKFKNVYRRDRNITLEIPAVEAGKYRIEQMPINDIEVRFAKDSFFAKTIVYSGTEGKTYRTWTSGAKGEERIVTREANEDLAEAGKFGLDD